MARVLTSLAASVLMVGCVSPSSLTYQQPALSQGNATWCEAPGFQLDGAEAAHCEVRPIRVDLTRPIRVDAGVAGGIAASGWDRDDATVEARILVFSSDERRARSLAEQVVFREGDALSASVPRTRRGELVDVSYRLRLPRHTELDLSTQNGGIDVRGMVGTTRYRTVNGGVDLTDLGGDVSGTTLNGSAQVRLTGTTWVGEGLDVHVVNGTLSLSLPEAYSASLDAQVTNGDLDYGIPTPTPSATDILERRVAKLSLGDGGPLVRLRTQNGRLAIKGH
ncbi:MAG: hypothetical protein AAF089_00335 [Bacteroidota bacterium]